MTVRYQYSHRSILGCGRSIINEVRNTTGAFVKVCSVHSSVTRRFAGLLYAASRWRTRYQGRTIVLSWCLGMTATSRKALLVFRSTQLLPADVPLNHLAGYCTRSGFSRRNSGGRTGGRTGGRGTAQSPATIRLPVWIASAQLSPAAELLLLPTSARLQLTRLWRTAPSTCAAAAVARVRISTRPTQYVPAATAAQYIPAATSKLLRKPAACLY